jgi:hypothetical protein
MIADAASEHDWLVSDEGILIPYSSGTKSGPSDRYQITLAGGRVLNVPVVARLHDPTGTVRAQNILSGYRCLALLYVEPPATSDVPYSYTWKDNHSVEHKEQGVHTFTEDECELIGWLCASKSVDAYRQAVRFSSSEAGALHRVEMLSKKAAPTVTVSIYAKNRGYDLVFTEGINNSLKHLIKKLGATEGTPRAFCELDKACRRAFLRGYWGANGWAYTRKNGKDVTLGLQAVAEPSVVHWQQAIHSMIGMRGAIRTIKSGRQRLVFDGYPNYATFLREIGQIGSLSLPTLPVQTASKLKTVAIGSCVWYETTVRKITRLAHGPYYRIPGAWTTLIR